MSPIFSSPDNLHRSGQSDGIHTRVVLSAAARVGLPQLPHRLHAHQLHPLHDIMLCQLFLAVLRWRKQPCQQCLGQPVAAATAASGVRAAPVAGSAAEQRLSGAGRLQLHMCIRDAPGNSTGQDKGRGRPRQSNSSSASHWVIHLVVRIARHKL